MTKHFHKTEEAHQETLNSIEKYKKAVEVAVSRNDHIDEARLRHTIGTLYNEIDKFNEALEYLTQARQICAETGTTGQKIWSINGVALVYYEHGDLQKASDIYNEALALAVDENEPFWEAAIRSYLAMIYTDQDKLTDAESELEKSVELYESISHPKTEVTRKKLRKIKDKIIQKKSNF